MRPFAFAAAFCTAAFSAAIGVSHAAHAATLEYQILVDGVVVGMGNSSSGLILNASATSPLFSVLNIGTIAGVPTVPTPDLNSTTTSITTSAGFSGSHTVEIDVTQVGVTSPTGLISFGSTLTLNNLINGPTSTGVASAYSNYVDPGDGAFAKTTSVASLTGLAKAATSNGGGAYMTVDVGQGTYSETEVLTATFNGNGEVLNSTDQLTGVAVPEPAAWTVFGAGLVALGFLRRVRGV